MRFQLGFGAILWGVFLVLLHHIVAKSFQDDDNKSANRSLAREYRYRKN